MTTNLQFLEPFEQHLGHILADYGFETIHEVMEEGDEHSEWVNSEILGHSLLELSQTHPEELGFYKSTNWIPDGTRFVKTLVLQIGTSPMYTLHVSAQFAEPDGWMHDGSFYDHEVEGLAESTLEDILEVTAPHDLFHLIADGYLYQSEWYRKAKELLSES